MSTQKASILRERHKDVFGAPEEKTQVVPEGTKLDVYYKNNSQLKDIPPQVIRNAWFTMAHLLLEPGSVIADIGCSSGETTYAMAIMHPEYQFIGIDYNKRHINQAQKHYNLPNLTYQAADITKKTDLKIESLDAVVISFTLHEIYSRARHNERKVLTTLETMFGLLKPEGVIFLQDYAMPPPHEYVILEIPEKPTPPSTEQDIMTISDADLLVWYADNARPKESPGCNGFYLEELPPNFPQTRRFRLPYKWAYEFFMRKDDRENFENELHKEYVFFTRREYRKHLANILGARVLYAASHWDDSFIKEHLQKSLRLYDDNGKPLGTPPTSFVALAQKASEGQSLALHERRSLQSNGSGSLRVQTVRHSKTGKIMEIVKRDYQTSDILPYCFGENDELMIYIHESLPRCLANTIPRKGRDLDDKRWSGHMIEAISVDANIVRETPVEDMKAAALFGRDYLGLKPAGGKALETGPVFYPAPESIDDRVETRFVCVQSKDAPIEPKAYNRDFQGFKAKGKVRLVSAQKVLNAISIGLIPNARLELQIDALYKKLGRKAQMWVDSPLSLTETVQDKRLEKEKFFTSVEMNEEPFKDVKGSIGEIKTVQSTFVDTGRVDGSFSGLASRDVEFMINADSTINKAVVIPLTRDLNSNENMIGFEVEHMPVPQRHSDNSLMMKAPSCNLPQDIVHIEEAQKYISDKFGVPIENVWRLGESYFCHIGLTPIRVFPFAIAAKPNAGNPWGGPITFAPVAELYRLLDIDYYYRADINFLRGIKDAARSMSYDSEFNLKINMGQAMLADNSAPAALHATEIVPTAATSTETSAASYSQRFGSSAGSSEQDNQQTSHRAEKREARPS